MTTSTSPGSGWVRRPGRVAIALSATSGELADVQSVLSRGRRVSDGFFWTGKLRRVARAARTVSLSVEAESGVSTAAYQDSGGALSPDCAIAFSAATRATPTAFGSATVVARSVWMP